MSKPQVIFMLGGPGAGKGTICKYIVEKYKFATFSTGELLRNVVKEKKDKNWEKLDSDMKEGKLISSERVLLYLKDAILKTDQKIIFVDGYPRNEENVKVWDKIMSDFVDLKAVFFLDCSHELMKKRIYKRKDDRFDDNEETIKKRINVFEKETKPLIPLFKEKGLLINIDCHKEFDDIFIEVDNVLKDLKLI